MVVCFNCSAATKEKLDIILSGGGYQDYGAVISSAIENLLVLQEQVIRSGSVCLELGSPCVSRQPTGTTPKLADGVAGAIPSPPSRADHVDVFTNFELRHFSLLPDLALPYEASGKAGSGPDRWLFGQYNKFLPLKANCRLIAHMLHDSPAGITLQSLVETIQLYMPSLRQWLEEFDAKHSLEREAALATAFPTKDSKSLLRYTNQFVMSVNKGGVLSGFPVAFGLLNRLDTKETRLSLTEAGLRFALLPNPVLDPPRQPQERLSREELAFLLNHVRTAVPQESSAYGTVLSAIESGSANPEALDAALRALVGADANISDAYLSTQRAGVISRMSDLGLVARQREGIRVTYFVTKEGREFTNGEQNAAA